MADLSAMAGRRPRRPPARRRRRARRRRLLTRGGPVAAVAAASFAVGVVVATGPGRSERRTAEHYASAWARGDVPAMYAELAAASRARTSEPRFATELRRAETTATLRSLRVLRVGRAHGGTVPVTMAVRTRVWGRLRETLAVTLAGHGSSARVHLQSSLLFPGLRPGEALSRRMRLPVRASLLAADGTPLAEGSARTSPIPAVAGEIVGSLGPIPAGERMRAAADGFPGGARVGIDGLERIFQRRLVGTPGGTLRAGRRTLASAAAVPARAVRTTIVPALEQAAVQALGDSYAGMAVLDPSTGAVQAAAGLAFSALQPPGSTMKIVTVTAVLQARLASPGTVYPVQTSATVDGFTMQNAGGEACGGTLLNAFAVSCNSVYAPLGARLGAARLVAAARRFGFDAPAPFAGALSPTIPAAKALDSSLAVAASAIGQGTVQSTPLGQADVAATIADGGRRPIPTMLAGARPRFVRVTTPAVAREVQSMMEAVVAYGTGVPAQIPGVTVAGKTGTAELVDTGNGAAAGAANNPKDTDAWFVGYAPAERTGRARVVAAALFPGSGAGEEAAAPPVREVLEAALAR